MTTVIDPATIDAILPQTQCQECGFAGCMPYAQALAQNRTSIDRCPPGGKETAVALGKLLGIDAEVVQIAARAPSVATIQESACIGCTKCIQACPVDAIIGSAKAMHAIITQDCTGCGLCVAPCPMDCITMVPLEKPAYDKDRARANYQARSLRLRAEARQKKQGYQDNVDLTQINSTTNATTSAITNATIKTADHLAKQAYIQAAHARVQAKKKMQNQE